MDSAHSATMLIGTGSTDRLFLWWSKPTVNQFNVVFGAAVRGGE